MKSSILSSISFQLDKTFRHVVSAAVEQSRRKANMVLRETGSLARIPSQKDTILNENVPASRTTLQLLSLHSLKVINSFLYSLGLSLKSNFRFCNIFYSNSLTNITWSQAFASCFLYCLKFIWFH